MSTPPDELETEIGEAVVAKVSWWVHMVPVFVAIIGLIQAAGFVWLGSSTQQTTAAVVSVKEGVENTTKAINTMEAQINSNMERQIRQAIKEAMAIKEKAIAEETLRSLREEVFRDNMDAVKDAKEENRRAADKAALDAARDKADESPPPSPADQ